VTGPPAGATPTTSEHWANGGETNLDDLTLLCRHHHRLTHHAQRSPPQTG
jgi:hypothetical protein